MRNLLYPRQKAAYVTEAQLRELKNQNIVIERDFNFGLERSEDEHTSNLPRSTGESLAETRAQILSVISFPDVATPLHNANRHSARKSDTDFISEFASFACFLSKPNTAASARSSSS